MPQEKLAPSPRLPNISRRTARFASLGLFAGSGLLGFGTARAQDATGSSPLVDTSAQARYPELSFINLAGNEKPFGPSRRVTMTLMREAANSSRYPFRETNILRDEIAAAEGVPPDHIPHWKWGRRGPRLSWRGIWKTGCGDRRRPSRPISR